MIKIEKGIPIPKDVRGRKSKYPIEKLEVGDSFHVESITRQSLFSSCRKYVNMGWKFTTRKTGNGIRIWRVK